ncbi:hypothetical protein [Sphingobacterium humi]|uniref:DUF2892 domain-containing protein n=1 Tax=Sphingobacterium humi TaxID=1796905 RepID=A0A6N8L4Q2_9SPHI|nr:hypothetical protein [Sphingobacterium humi]MVZ63431.1 hypothetical protein [Sphingobacterium humi]
MMQYLKNWNVVRILRLVMGIIITVQGIQAGHWLIVALGALFVVLPLLNISTCASGSCEVPRHRRPAKIKNEDPSTFENVK